MTEHSQTSMSKSVSFYHNVHVKPQLHIKNYTREERKATWYAMAEIQEQKADLRKDVQRMLREQRAKNASEFAFCFDEESDDDEPENDEYLGLERRTPEASQRVLKRRQHAAEAVFIEQASGSDPEFMKCTQTRSER